MEECCPANIQLFLCHLRKEGNNCVFYYNGWYMCSLRAGTFTDERIAEEQVVSVLNFDIHLVKDFRGKRYIERITECIPIEDTGEYNYEYRKEKTIEVTITEDVSADSQDWYKV